MPSIPSPVRPPQVDSQNLGDANRLFVIFEIVDPNDVSIQTLQTGIPPLLLHVNPTNWAEAYRKIINRDYTRGGYVEYHWGEELDTITCQASTGAFMSPATGLASLNRRATIAWQRFDDLFSLYRMNGNIYDANGSTVFHGGIRIHYDGGTYTGYFTSFTYTEAADSPFKFEMNWTFKVDEQLREIGL